jgi:hypothetical protein
MQWDSDDDGTLDMAEVETAGATIFATLDKDKERWTLAS